MNKTSQENHLSDSSKDLVLQIYINYDLHRENLNERRSARNNFFVGFLSVLLTTMLALNYSQGSSNVDPKFFVIMSMVGLSFCVVWYFNLATISERIDSIYKNIIEIEKNFPVRPYTMEVEMLKSSSRYGHLKIIAIEKAAPLVIGAGFILMFILSL